MKPRCTGNSLMKTDFQPYCLDDYKGMARKNLKWIIYTKSDVYVCELQKLDFWLHKLKNLRFDYHPGSNLFHGMNKFFPISRLQVIVQCRHPHLDEKWPPKGKESKCLWTQKIIATTCKITRPHTIWCTTGKWDGLGSKLNPNGDGIWLKTHLGTPRMTILCLLYVKNVIIPPKQIYFKLSKTIFCLTICREIWHKLDSEKAHSCHFCPTIGICTKMYALNTTTVFRSIGILIHILFVAKLLLGTIFFCFFHGIS